MRYEPSSRESLGVGVQLSQPAADGLLMRYGRDRLIVGYKYVLEIKAGRLYLRPRARRPLRPSTAERYRAEYQAEVPPRRPA
jgi:hypothetical protein